VYEEKSGEAWEEKEEEAELRCIMVIINIHVTNPFLSGPRLGKTQEQTGTGQGSHALYAVHHDP
jgi:hypothetical protein